MTRLRHEMYVKLLQLPIGYFTEQRKGDIMSRMTNDIGELEGSVVSTLEGFIKDPLNILIILATLIYISPQLSLFLLIFLPLNRGYYWPDKPLFKKTIEYGRDFNWRGPIGTR